MTDLVPEAGAVFMLRCIYEGQEVNSQMGFATDVPVPPVKSSTQIRSTLNIQTPLIKGHFLSAGFIPYTRALVLQLF